MSNHLRFRRYSSRGWAQLNLVLLSGEPGLETDTLKLKIGDGSTPWNELPYFAESSEVAAPTEPTEPGVTVTDNGDGSFTMSGPDVIVPEPEA